MSHVLFTMAGCDGNEGEGGYQRLLETTDRWAVPDGQLVLSGPQGRLRFAPAGQ